MLTFAQDGRLVSAGYDGTVRVWDFKNPARSRSSSLANRLPFKAWSSPPMGGLLSVRAITSHSCGTPGAQRPLRLSSDRRASSRASSVGSLALVADGRLAAGYEENGQVHLWNLEKPTTKPLIVHDTVTKGLSAMSIAPTGGSSSAASAEQRSSLTLKTPNLRRWSLPANYAR